MINLDLSGKTAFVGGSTQGIGKATAIELAEMGASVVLLARQEDRLRAVLNELPQSKGQVHDYIAVDFSRPDELGRKVCHWVEKHRRAHILVNNTGGPSAGQIFDAEVDAFLEAFRQHLFCNQILVQSLVPWMKNASYGRIVNVISTSVREPIANLGVSNTTRGAVASWAKTLSGELASSQITVNNVLPGATDTQRLRALIEGKAQKSGKSIPEIEKEMQSEIPMRRFASAQEVAAVIAFLCSPAASYLSGQSIAVDGGRMRSI
jgi:3-oxoacyl-[acyl-carrier protein] reductase